MAGGLGTLARFGLTSLARRILPNAFPWGTFAVNILGCFLFGIIWSLGEDKLNTETKMVILIGFMGAFTTFSTFIYDTYCLATFSGFFISFINVFMQISLGYLAFLLAWYLCK